MKNKNYLSYLLNYTVEDLYEYLTFFVSYFCILLFFKFNEKTKYILYIFLGIIIIENLLKYFKCKKKKEAIIKLITTTVPLIIFLYFINKNFIDETKNFIISLKSSDFYPLNTIFFFIFAIIIIFDGIFIFINKIKIFLILLKNRKMVL
ncbi:hypothetical protein [Fusobacterium hwasookii]|uniref:hypothetical protein n=1 Tax=Fusobacterium hwasookii TaxID=1583098 RepID=UPI0004981E41|nr:hypothetical protein [Fusobacterium hwasookii]ALQ37985.1 hypothetical protein RN97_07105 [Fusobacterium hwasookii ChDC F300]